MQEQDSIVTFVDEKDEAFVVLKWRLYTNPEHDIEPSSGARSATSQGDS